MTKHPIDAETIELLGEMSFINGVRQALRSILDLQKSRSDVDLDSLFAAIEAAKEELDDMIPDEIKELDNMAPAFEIRLRAETLQ